MELCSLLCASLDGRGIWMRMGTCMFMAESLHCSPETITILLIGYAHRPPPPPPQKKTTKKTKQNSKVYFISMTMFYF